MVDLPYACFGVVAQVGIVRHAPPIARWMVGRSIGQIVPWVQGKGGTVEFVKDDPLVGIEGQRDIERGIDGD